jgi:hypothetical protein
MSESASSRLYGRESSETLDEIAARIYESQRRDRGRMISLAVRGLLLFVVPCVGIAVWICTIGYQRHVLEIRDGNSGFRIVSRHSPFEIEVPGKEFATLVPGGTFVETKDRVEGSSIQPRWYAWASFVDTKQIVRLPVGTSTLDFWANDVHFELAGGELVSGQRRWQFKPNGMTTIDLDRLTPTIGPPPRTAVTKKMLGR